jgi:2-phospho-L-lactate/phosphoenolpyruvate guanylyltransferase
MPVSNPWVVVVARVGDGAKSRLGQVLDPAQRQALARAMLADVLAVCTSVDALDGVLAVLDTPEARTLACSLGVRAIHDPGGDMNAAAGAGLAAAQACGAQTAIVLPGDIPLLTVSDLEALVAAAADAPYTVVIGASRDGLGTNALLLRPPDVIRPSFGPPSVERHVRLGDQAHAATHVLPHLGLAHDVDTPRDLSALADLSVGAHTARFLMGLPAARSLSRI